MGLLAGALGLLTATPATAQVPGPPGEPPSEQRGGAPVSPAGEVPADGPMKCVPTVECVKSDKRVYSCVRYNVCYPKCSLHGCGHGCGDCEASCEGDCHKCSKVYTKKYLVLHIRKEEREVHRCTPVPCCEEQCAAPACGAPACGEQGCGAPVQGAPVHGAQVYGAPGYGASYGAPAHGAVIMPYQSQPANQGQPYYQSQPVLQGQPAYQGQPVYQAQPMPQAR
jgi:hypothetical protein